MLLVALVIFAVIWIAVLWGSRYFGPESLGVWRRYRSGAARYRRRLEVGRIRRVLRQQVGQFARHASALGVMQRRRQPPRGDRSRSRAIASVSGRHQWPGAARVSTDKTTPVHVALVSIWSGSKL